MKILLVGGAGNIGSHLNSQLKEHNSITSIDYGSDPVKKHFLNLDLADVGRVNTFSDSCDHYDILIFLVGLAYTKGKRKDFS